MYPCPYCHTQLVWVAQYQQYYCYFCHRYVQAAAPPPSYQPWPAQFPTPQPAPPPTTSSSGQPPAPTATPSGESVRPVPVGDGAAANTSGQVHSRHTESSSKQPSPAPKPSIEYVKPGEADKPADTAQAADPRAPIYLCKTCGSRLVVAGDRWYCPACQQLK